MILEELVKAAIDVCGADSSGISTINRLCHSLVS
jgi:hypothetical protein